MDTLSRTRDPAPEAQREPPQPQGGALAAAPARQRHAPPATATPRRSKADALRIANHLKRGVAVAAMLGFSMFGVAAGSHIAATAATTTTATSSSGTSTGTSSTTSGGSYFTQQSGGSSFGSSSSTATSTPVTSTGVS